MNDTLDVATERYASVTSRGIDARVSPEGTLDVLSQVEVNRLRDTSESGPHEVLRRCALAVLNTGSRIDSGKEILERYPDFDIRVVPQDRGIKLEIRNAPPGAFVDGQMILGIKEHLFAVLRDIVYTSSELERHVGAPLEGPEAITDAVFHILRNAQVLKSQVDTGLVVCWGGHSISREEYDYTKEVGYELGLRGLNICTGCGPGAMKGPMKGATIAHAKQRIYRGRYIGITEPGIIAAEAPNPLVNSLVIMPDIEKRLEAFVRLGHGIVVFPGGAGTAEEVLYLLGILLHPHNADQRYPLILTGPRASEGYFRQIHEFIGATLGTAAQRLYRVVIGDPARVGREIKEAVAEVGHYRRAVNDAFFFNWRLRIESEFQQPFRPTHETMRALPLRAGQPSHVMAAALRRAFSGVVAGNVKAEGIRAIESRGPFEVAGDPAIMRPLDRLLAAFVAQGRMKLAASGYEPCYRIVEG